MKANRILAGKVFRFNVELRYKGVVKSEKMSK
jgi:hypothetical protein